jgi:hypothetical protein
VWKGCGKLITPADATATAHRDSVEHQLMGNDGHPYRDGAGTRAIDLSGELGVRFRSALFRDDHDEDPATLLQLLPARLCLACVEVLGVDGAGVSVLSDDFRVPLGASDEVATMAERLQFTTGEGPCLQAVHAHRPVSAADGALRTHWPVFAERLFAQTPYRAVMSLPVGHDRGQFGALDLYWTDPAASRTLTTVDAITVTDEIYRALTISTPDAVTGLADPAQPVWLRGGVPRARMNVWIAVGILITDLDASAPDALALLRAYAYSHDTSVDSTAHDLTDGTLTAGEFMS